MTIDIAERLLEQIAAVDPRIGVDTLLRPERQLLLEQPTADDDDVAVARRTIEEKLARVDVAYGWGTEVAALLGRAPRLRWVQLSSAGSDNVLGHPIFESGRVLFTNVRGSASVTVAEYIFGMIFALAKGVPQGLRQQIEHRWQRYPNHELQRKTLGIVGYGSIGEETARLAHALGMRVLATRRSVQQPASNEHVDRLLPAAMLPELLAESDFVALTAPLTAETAGLIGEQELRRMKPSAYLINAARGPIVDQAALVRALQEHWIAGAALDVFDQEPLPANSPLWDFEQVIITPHDATQIADYHVRTTQIFCDNLRRFLAGEPLLNPVDPARGY